MPPESTLKRCRNAAIFLILAGFCGRTAATEPSEEQESHAEKRTAWAWLKPAKVGLASKETAKILPDDSVELCKPAPAWSECSVSYPVSRGFSLRQLKVEFLAHTEADANSLGRDSRPPVVFSLQIFRQREGKLIQLEADTGQCLADWADEESLNNLFDGDSGSGLKLPKGGKPREVTVKLSAPHKFLPGDKLVVVVDSGGNSSDGVVSRFRVRTPVTR